jgi:hypothetical protein
MVLVSGSCLAENAFYRIMKPPADICGTLSSGDTPQPTNAITIIDCNGDKKGPYLKSDGYTWKLLEDNPCLKAGPVLTATDVEGWRKAGLVVGSNVLAYANKDEETVVLTTKVSLTDSNEIVAANELLGGKLNEITGSNLVAAIDVTYRINGEVMKSAAKMDAAVSKAIHQTGLEAGRTVDHVAEVPKKVAEQLRRFIKRW